MKLYLSPGACSFAPHIVLHELGLPVQAVKVDLRSHKLSDGTDYYTINPKGYVPMLELDDGTRLAETAVILQYLADRKPGTLAPVAGSVERYKLMEWLNFTATEIHKGYSPLWSPDTPEPVRESIVTKLRKRYAVVEEALGRHAHLAGAAFTIADAYLYTVTQWAKYLKVDLSAFPELGVYMARLAERPSVIAAKAAESSPVM